MAFEKKPEFLLGVRYKGRTDDAPPGLMWRKAKNGETLGSIADDCHIRWIDLALYNWHTTDLAEVNWYLHHYVGCTQHNSRTYSFTGSEKTGTHKELDGGYLLVPDKLSDADKGVQRSVAAVRNGAATYNAHLQVHVLDFSVTDRVPEVVGKWVYVFSADNGIDFGYDPPPKPEPVDGPDDAQPGTAFTPEYPGYFPISKRPTRLEYEILVTPNESASTDMLALSGLKDPGGEPYYKPSGLWYFLSDRAILERATSESRDERDGKHEFRNTKLVTIDLTGSNRYYFLISPVQLGPEALKYAMANPKGLTPLLKPFVNAPQFDPDNPADPQPHQYTGPIATDYKGSVITLPVIDPYGWADALAEIRYQAHLTAYVDWLGMNGKSAGKDKMIKDLIDETKWDLDQMYIAQMLKTVSDRSPAALIPSELQDPDKWRANVKLWSEKLVERDAEINANAHRSLLELIDWMQGPGHTIVETAILKDATADTLHSAIDIARGIVHWHACTEQIVMLAPGAKFLRGLFSSSGSVPADIVIKDLDADPNVSKITERNKVAFRFASPGSLLLLALKDFVSPAPQIAYDGSRADYLMKLADFEAKRRDRLIKILNDSKILPVRVKALPLPDFQAPMSRFQVFGAAVNSCLDVADKLATWTMSENISLPRKIGLSLVAMFEQYMKGRKVLSGYLRLGVAGLLKVTALPLNVLNLYSVATAARYDYENNLSTVSGWDYASAVSGTTLALQDLLSEVGGYFAKKGLNKIFPSLVDPATGPGWGVGITVTEGAVGWIFVRINVLAALVAGITTIVSMTKSQAGALSRGDYTAARYYRIGKVGGYMMTGGAVCLALSLIGVGSIFTATGVGASIGVILICVGGAIAFVANVGGSANTSSPYRVYARKCFLGTQADVEPRFDDDPPSWSGALKGRRNTWPIEMQKKGLHNLLGLFTVKTKLVPAEVIGQDSFTCVVAYEIQPGWFMPGCTIEIALYFDTNKSAISASTLKWTPGGPGQDNFQIVGKKQNGIFNPDQTNIYFHQSDHTLTGIDIYARDVAYNSVKGSLMTTVTIQYPNLPNKISARKMVIKTFAHGWVEELNDAEITSDIFEYSTGG
jgi:hypothetical protein